MYQNPNAFNTPAQDPFRGENNTPAATHAVDPDARLTPEEVTPAHLRLPVGHGEGVYQSRNSGGSRTPQHAPETIALKAHVQRLPQITEAMPLPSGPSRHLGHNATAGATGTLYYSARHIQR